MLDFIWYNGDLYNLDYSMLLAKYIVEGNCPVGLEGAKSILEGSISQLRNHITLACGYVCIQTYIFVSQSQPLTCQRAPAVSSYSSISLMHSNGATG